MITINSMWSEPPRLSRSPTNRSNLSSVLKTMEMVQERFRIMENLKRLLFQDVGADEVSHIQAMFQNNLWILGEKYHLLTAAEPDFEQALREFRKHVYGEDEEQEIDHKDKNREMDLFMVRREIGAETIRCVVVELKHPSNVNLGKTQFSQICDYMDLVRSDERFNGSNLEWEFHLIGKSMNGGYIEDKIEACRPYGERHLAQWSRRHKLYVRTWSDVCADFEVRHNFINRNLDIMRESIAADTSIEVRFSASKSLWLDMVFVAGRQGRVVEVADTVWDAGELLRWLEAIVDGRPAAMECDREGIIDEVRAEPVDKTRVRLTIFKKWQEDEVYLDAVVGRRKLVWEVYYELSRVDKLLAVGDAYRAGWWRLPEVEAWLEWERTGRTLELYDPVAGRSRLGDPKR